MRSSVDFPQPEGPTKTVNEPDFDGEIDAVDDLDRLEALADALQLKLAPRSSAPTTMRSPGSQQRAAAPRRTTSPSRSAGLPVDRGAARQRRQAQAGDGELAAFAPTSVAVAAVERDLAPAAARRPEIDRRLRVRAGRKPISPMRWSKVSPL